MNVIRTLLVPVILVLIAGSCVTTDVIVGEELRAWVSIDPLQCDNNAWGSSGMSADDYYRSLGVDVSRMVTIRVYDVVCTACNCPTGDRLFLEVDRGSLDFMIGEGFTLSPAPSVKS